ncbi:AlpA family phage regulatory protein [Bradyrhizobium sp. Ash2021]|uniref:helix-turn-helix transcriptional regulator n=1 Tax=Bradyrhizobium sp. Ash2021 TaxID=2954771 RepID=UPI0028169D7D|nr:AlpA family phage regulatory protein [Bradyrhizobium sp. Ash2021]WMT73863.1 AlpA family phage regulatory protein [Bradyrhizobium sp. Ash2021]
MACKSKGERRRQPTLPVSKSTWWQGVKDGRFPRPVKLGAKTTAWRSYPRRMTRCAQPVWMGAFS